MSSAASVDDWQIAGIKKATASLDRGEGVPHEQVKDWIESWGGKNERDAPRPCRSRQAALQPTPPSS